MRGGFLHNNVLLDPVEEHFQLLGAKTKREYSTKARGLAGFIDLFVVHGQYRIACEAELSADRVRKDIQKALALESTHLLIVAPTRRVAEAVRRRIRKSTHEANNLSIWILPLGPAMARLSKRFPLISGLNVSEKTNKGRRGPRDQNS